MHLAHCPFGGQRIVTHDAIRDVIYVHVRMGMLYGENGGMPLR